jgi:hypothetical protein
MCTEGPNDLDCNRKFKRERRQEYEIAIKVKIRLSKIIKTVKLNPFSQILPYKEEYLQPAVWGI